MKKHRRFLRIIHWVRIKINNFLYTPYRGACYVETTRYKEIGYFFHFLLGLIMSPVLLIPLFYELLLAIPLLLPKKARG